MTDVPGDLAAPADLAARAARTHVVVIGGGVSGLVAARECAKVGMRVTVLEAADATGGAIRAAELDGIRLDAGAESYATRGGAVRALIEELGLGERVVRPAAGGAWLSGVPGGRAAPLPVGGILGIPANVFQDDVRRIIGWSGVWRAYLDRVRPPLTIGHTQSLGRLVATRMGEKVRDRLVAPVTHGVYSASPDDIDVEVAAPGLNAALTRMGSLSGAVAALKDQAQATKTPGAAVEGLDGGMSVLIDALTAEIEKLGGAVRTSAPVRSISARDDGWTIVHADAAEDDAVEDDAAEDDGAAEAERGIDGGVVSDARVGSDAAQGADAVGAGDAVIEADAVILATFEPVARELLAGIVPALAATEAAEAPEIEIVTLLVEAPALDSAPRGTGVLTVPGSHTAKALTHSTAKWGWVREAARGRHVLRVSFGAQGEPAATAALDDEGAARLALAEASALLGLPLPASAVVASHRSRFLQSQPASVIGSAERRTAARTAIRAVPRIAAVGAWLAGTGLAQVVPDAVSEADRLRHALLWD